MIGGSGAEENMHDEQSSIMNIVANDPIMPAAAATNDKSKKK